MTLASVHVDQAPQNPPDLSTLAIVRQIASTLQATIGASRADGSLRPRMQGFVRTTFTEWQYGEKGIAQHACETSLVAKQVWWGGPIEALIAKMDGEIERVAALLSAIDPTWQRTGDALVNVCEQLALSALEGTGWSDGDLGRLAGLLEATLRKQPVRAWIRADLVGVAVLTTPLEIEDGERRIRLRAIGRADLEGDTFVEWSDVASSRLRSRASAVLEVEYRAVDGSGWQPHLERAVAVLRLFGCGGVSWARVEAGTDALLEIHNVFVIVEPGGGVRTYAIGAADAARLPRFWHTLADALPVHFYWKQPDEPDGIHAALNNYQAVAAGFGIVHDKIAEAIRSLESLLLNDGAKGRVSATLQQRSVALLGACGYPAGEVATTMQLAYEVRSRHVHGGRLSRVKEEEIERAGGILKLFDRVLEYNRAALVATIVSRLDKPALIRAFRSPETLIRIARAFTDAEGRSR